MMLEHDRLIMGCLYLVESPGYNGKIPARPNAVQIGVSICRDVKETIYRLSKLIKMGLVTYDKPPRARPKSWLYSLTDEGRVIAGEYVGELVVERYLHSIAPDCRAVVKKKVIRHLLAQAGRGDDYEMPYETTRDGIAEAVGITPQRASGCMGRMVAMGHAECLLRHPSGTDGSTRKRKCYRLTPIGLEIARRLEGVSRMEDWQIAVLNSGNIRVDQDERTGYRLVIRRTDARNRMPVQQIVAVVKGSKRKPVIMRPDSPGTGMFADRREVLDQLMSTPEYEEYTIWMAEARMNGVIRWGTAR